MLRSTTSRVSCARGFHTSLATLAAKGAPVKKAASQGYKKTNTGKTKKTSGAGKQFSDYINVLKLENKAPEIKGLGTLEGEKIKENSVLKYNQLQMKKLIISGTFKDNQFKELFKTPITLVTKDTKHMEEFVKNGSNTSSEHNRICLLGENGIGKSTLLAQTQAMISNLGDSIIIPIPYATQIVNGRNDFAYDQQLKLYTQPMFLKSFISKILDTNDKILAKIPIKSDHSFEGNTRHKSTIKVSSERHSLLDLAKLSVAPRFRGRQLESIFTELLEQDQIPIFLTVDNFNALTSFTRTAYRDVENKPVHIGKLQLGKLIFDFTSGARAFKKGGVILATSTDERSNHTLLAGLGLTKPDPYTAEYYYDREVAQKLNGVKPYELQKLSKENVTKLVETFINADIFKSNDLENKTLEALVNQKYILSGNGNPGELIKSVVMSN